MNSYEELIKEFEAGDFWNFINFKFQEISEGYASIKIHLRKEILNMQKVLHGGIIMSGLDMVMGLTARTTGAKKVSTLQMETRFLKGVVTGEVHFKGYIIHIANNTVVLKGIVEDINEEMIAYSTSTFKVEY